ncbi:MAG: hypothetical protein WC119_00930 [Synergistaceae bacterium]
MKKYNLQYNVGNAKYVVNFTDGHRRHNDGSAFYDIRTFKNKKKQESFVKELIEKGFVYS